MHFAGVDDVFAAAENGRGRGREARSLLTGGVRHKLLGSTRMDTTSLVR